MALNSHPEASSRWKKSTAPPTHRLQRSTIHSSRHCFATGRREGSRRWSLAASIGVFLLFFYHIDFCARSYDCVFIGTEGVASYVYSVQYERTQVVCKKTNPKFFFLCERKKPNAKLKCVVLWMASVQTSSDKASPATNMWIVTRQHHVLHMGLCLHHRPISTQNTDFSRGLMPAAVCPTARWFCRWWTTGPVRLAKI